METHKLVSVSGVLNAVGVSGVLVMQSNSFVAFMRCKEENSG